MKTAVELAMSKGVTKKLSFDQRARIAKLNDELNARLVQVSVDYDLKINSAMEAGEYEKAEQLKLAWLLERGALRKQRDDLTETVRNAAAT